MSKLFNKYTNLKLKNPDCIYLFKSGIFFITLDADAELCNKIANLKLTPFTSTVMKCGFPINQLSKYAEIFHKNNISFLIVDDSSFNSAISLNSYLSNNHFVKRKLKIKYYVRFMDDFIILAKTKVQCKELKTQIEQFLYDNLKLELNAKSRYYPASMGVDFCGYRIFTTHKLLRNSSKKKIKKNVKKWNYLYHTKNFNATQVMQSLNSWIAHSSHCNSYHLKNKILNSCDFIFK